MRMIYQARIFPDFRMDTKSPGLNFKKSNIRIWIHQRNMKNLQQLVWDGYGGTLLVEHSNNHKIRRFLEGVPYVMGLIRDIHSDVQNGDLESLKNRIKPPVPGAVLLARDGNGLTPLHKAVGLGKEEIAKYIVDLEPSTVMAVDHGNRTPLHYSAVLKDGDKMYDYLIENGADEHALDKKQKTAAFYRTKSTELQIKQLNSIPECPRSVKKPTSFDWRFFSSEKLFTPEDINGTVVEDPNLDDESPKSVHNSDEGVEKNAKSEDTRKPEPMPIKQDIEEVDQHNISQPERTSDDPITQDHDQQSLNIETANDEMVDTSMNEESTDNVDQEKQTEPDQHALEYEPSALEESHNKDTTKVHEETKAGHDTLSKTPEFHEDTSPKSLTDIKSIIDSGNLDLLANLVLSGEGHKLIGEKSNIEEMQAFLDNVPVYMTKIKRIHIAAQEGALRDLQAALDRRKFAIAKDKISPNGATPLHVAIIFGRTSVVRYLAGRFPETVHATDDNGRTPLHYAAVLPDNGHYYKLLLHLGADGNIKDKANHLPDFYIENQSEFSHSKLLNNFDVRYEEEGISKVQDNNNEEDQENGQSDMPFFATEEGRYLASCES